MMELVVFLAINGAVVTLVTVGIYEALRQKWETVSALIAAGAGAAVSSIVVGVAIAIVFGVNIVALWTNWSIYIMVIGGLLGLFTSLSGLGIWEVFSRNGWYGTTCFVAIAVVGAGFNNFYFWGSVLFGGAISWLFGGGR